MGFLAGKLYQLRCEVITGEENASIVSEDLPEVDLWHQRLGHLNRQQLNTLVTDAILVASKPREQEPLLRVSTVLLVAATGWRR